MCRLACHQVVQLVPSRIQHPSVHSKHLSPLRHHAWDYRGHGPQTQDRAPCHLQRSVDAFHGVSIDQLDVAAAPFLEHWDQLDVAPFLGR